MTSRVLRKAVVAASGALLLGGLAVAPAVAAPSSGVRSIAADHGCSKGRNLTNGWGQCTGRGTYYWHVEVDCTLGGSGSSSTQAGRGKTYAYCNWGYVESVKIIMEA